MNPRPRYVGKDLNPAYCLRYSWTGWPSAPRFENSPDDAVLESLRDSWEADGMRLLEWKWTEKQIQLTFSTTPAVSPVFLASRAKGRLQYTLRKASVPERFSRKLSVRSIGDNTTGDVEDYIKKQVRKESFVDAVFAGKMQKLIFVAPEVDLSKPSLSGSGTYWYNLHLVLVVEGRSRIADLNRLSQLREGALRISEKKRYGVSTLSVMPDHLHVALRGDPAQSPLDIALAFQNNLTYMLRQPIWTENFYVGTFSEYSMNAIRRLRATNFTQ